MPNSTPTREQVNVRALAGCLRRGRAVAAHTSKFHVVRGEDDRATERAQQAYLGQLYRMYTELDAAGWHTISYKPSKRMVAAGLDAGRQFASVYSSQSIPRPIRQAIVAGYAIDLDMVNAHPVILLWLANQNNFGDRLVLLQEYVGRRAEFFAGVLADLADVAVPAGVTLDNTWVKVQVLAMVNGGACTKLRAKSTRLARIHQELAAFATYMAPQLKYLREVCEETTATSFAPLTNRMLIMHVGSIERQILDAVVDELAGVGIQAACLIFDGAHFQCTPDTETHVRTQIQSEIPRLEAAIVARGLPGVSLAVKSFDNAVDWEKLPEDTAETSWTPQIFSEGRTAVALAASTWTFEEMFQELAATTFESAGETIAYLARKIPGCLVQVCEGDAYYVAKGKLNSSNWINRFERNAAYDVRVRWQEPPTKTKSGKWLEGDITTRALSEILRDNPRLLPRVTHTDYYADPAECPEDVLNLYADKVVDADSVEAVGDADRLGIFQEIVRMVWAGADPEVYRWVIAWIRHVVCAAGQPRTAIFLCGEEGTGKSFVASFIARWIFGDALAVEFTGVEKLLGRFGTAIAGKRLAIINEMASARADTLQNFDKLKALITERTMQIEPKGKAERTIRNNAAFILSSNNDDALRTGRSDRRYTALRTASTYRGNTKFWTRAASLLLCPAGGNAVYRWLAGLNAEDWPDPTQTYTTDFHAEIVVDSERASVRFIREFAEQVSEAAVDQWTTAELYSRFCVWAGDSGEKPVSKCTFGKEVKAAAGASATCLPFVYVEKLRGYRRRAEPVVTEVLPVVVDAPVEPPAQVVRRPRRQAPRKTFPGVTLPSEEFVDAAVRTLCPSD